MRAGHNQKQIAQMLSRNKSTISRELSRNGGRRGYRPKQADRLAQERAQGCRNAERVSPDIMWRAFDLLKQQWSPEQIAGHMPISHETIYRHVYADKASGGNVTQEDEIDVGRSLGAGRLVSALPILKQEIELAIGKVIP